MRNIFTISRQQFWTATIVSVCLILIALFYGWVTWEGNEENNGVTEGMPADTASGRELQADGIGEGNSHAADQNETSEEVYEAEYNDVVSSSPGFMLPVQGEVFREHSMTELTYFPTLDQYMTHKGIDILADEGTQVCAAEEGVVSKVIDDKAMGKTVWIAHHGEVITVYSNLSEEIAVEEGDTVTKGQIIGTAGNTSLFEKADEPHVHVEVMLKGEPANPADYFRY